MKLTLVRHAKSVYNEKGLFQGRIDCSLCEEGIKMTKEVAKNFSKDFDVCFCSPLKRTKMTAKLLVPDVKTIYDERLIERCMGEFEGTLVTGEKLAMLDCCGTPVNGESVSDLNKRICEFTQMLKKEHNGKNVLVITHSGIMHTFFRLANCDKKGVSNLEKVEIDI